MAVYTYNFAKFTEWPPTAFPEPDSPLNFCILGENPFGIALAAVEGKQVRGHEVRVSAYPRVGVVTRCHLLFVGRSERDRIEFIIKTLESKPILTVSDIPNFSRGGGMITLVRRQRKLHFEINRAAISRAGLKVSSELLKLAILVEED